MSGGPGGRIPGPGPHAPGGLPPAPDYAAPRVLSAPVELTLDLRGTAPDKVLTRLLGALERVSDDVTLVALVRDTPEYASAMPSVYGALRGRGYWSDSSRYPAGVQRLRVGRRRTPRANGAPARLAGETDGETAYAPAPPRGSDGPVES